MSRLEFLDTLRRRLAGLPEAEIDDLVGDYAAHFADGMAAGRSEAEIAEALGDPMRLARELRAEAGFRRWESAPTPSNFVAVLFGFLALIAVDFMFLLPFLGVLVVVVIVAGFAMLGLSVAGVVLVLGLFRLDHGFSLHYFGRIFAGIGLLGIGVGGAATLLLLIDYVVRLLGRYARLHYTLLNQASHAAA
jgi:uncharacterized membrane protein